VAHALTPPYNVAALVVLLAGLAKLRVPGAAADALATLGISGLGPAGRARAIRAVALAEVAVACLALAGATLGHYVLAVAYLGFAGAAVGLLRARAQCGCFGESGAPVSLVHVALNLALAGVCVSAGASGAGGLPEILDLPAWEVAPALLGILAAGGAAVLAYTELPRAWQAWGGAA
jgi:hypothetical protein